jgi:hypothetical protein
VNSDGVRVKFKEADKSHDWSIRGSIKDRLKVNARCVVCGVRFGSLSYLNEPCWIYEVMTS